MGFAIGRGTLLGTGYISVTADTADAESKMGLLGKGLGVAAAGFTVLAAAAAGTVMMASKFNSEMLKVQTQAGASSSDVRTLSKDILNMGNAQQGPDQLAEAMYHLKSIGLDNVDAMKDLRVASDLAAVGGSNLEDTTNALGGAWRSGIKGAQTFAMAAGSVNAIIGAGNMRMSDFVAAIGTGILPAAKTFGVSLNQVGAALALMTDEGVPATDAATRLKMSFSLLAAPSNAAAKQLKTIGLTGLELANTMRGPTGLVGTIQLLKDHLDASGLSLSQQAILLSHAFGGGRSSSAILTMINNVGTLKTKLDQINATAGNLPSAIAAQRATLSAQLKIFESNMEDDGIKIGDSLIGPVTQFMSYINSTLLPGIGKVTTTLLGMVPVDKIKSDLGGLASGLSTFFSALTGGGAKKAPVVPLSPSSFRATSMPAAPIQMGGITWDSFTQIPHTPRGPLPGTPQLSRSSFYAPPAQNLLPSSAFYSTQGPAAAGGGPLTGSSFSQQIRTPTGPGAGPVIAPPSVSAWKTAGDVVSGALKDIEGVLVPVAKGFLSLKNVAVQLIPLIVPAVVTLASGVGKLLFPALQIVGTFLAKTFVPTMHNFGDIAAQLLPVLQPLAVAVGVTLFVALTATGFLLNKVIGPALVAVTGWMARNKDATYALAGFLVLLNAQFFILKIQSLAGAAGMAILWGWNVLVGIQMKANAIWTGVVTAAQWLWNTALVTSAVSMAGNVAGWVAWQAEMAADTVWQGIVTAAQWLWNVALIASDASTWLQVASWVALKAEMVSGAVWLGVVTAAQWLWNLAMDANPIALVVIAIAALVAGIIWVATKTTWFQTAWKYAWDFIKSAALDTWHFLDNDVIHPIANAFSWLWTNGIEPALRFIVLGFLDMAGTILKAEASMLGWVPGIGGLLKGAVKEFNSFRDGVNAALGGIAPKTVPVTISFNGVPEGSITGHSYTSTTGFSYSQGGLLDGPGTGTSDSIPLWGSKGEFMVNAKSTARHLPLLRSINAEKFARGGMVGFTNAATADMSVANRKDIAKETTSIVSSYVKANNAAMAKLSATVGGGIPTGNRLAIINAAMLAAGVPPPGTAAQWQAGMNTLIGRESGWNPNAINLTDSNAAAGHPSQGLAQTIPGTFNAYHAPGTSYSITDPVANVAAAIRYIVSSYGNITNVQQANANLPPKGYDVGGWLMPGKTLAVNNTGRPERVVGPHESMGDTYIFNFTGPVGSQAELENWTVRTLTSLKQRGRLRGLVGS